MSESTLSQFIKVLLTKAMYWPVKAKTLLNKKKSSADSEKYKIHLLKPKLDLIIEEVDANAAFEEKIRNEKIM